MQKYLCYSLDHHLSRSKSVFPLVRKTEEWIQRQAASQFWPSWDLRLDACCSGPGLPITVIPDSACGWDTATVQTNATWRTLTELKTEDHSSETTKSHLLSLQYLSTLQLILQSPSPSHCVSIRDRGLAFFKVWSKLEIGDHPWDLGW